MTIYYNDTPENIAFFSDLSGIPPIVSDAWMLCEGQDDQNHTPTNPLNILYTGHNTQIGHVGPTAIYDSPEDGLRQAWATLQLPYYIYVLRAIKTHDPLTISDAIEKSPWAGSHYGSNPHIFASGCISETIRRLQAEGKTYGKPTPPVIPPVHTSPILVKVKPVVTGNTELDKLTEAIHTNLQYINNKLALDLNDPVKEETYQEYVDKIGMYANEIAELAFKAAGGQTASV